MKRQAHTGFDCYRDNGFQKIGDVAPHSIQCVRTDSLKRRQILYLVVIESCHSRASATKLFVVSFDDAMRVEVVFNHRQACFACGADGLPDVLDLLITNGLKRASSAGKPAIGSKKGDRCGI